MTKTTKIIITVLLTVTLAVAGFFVGRQFQEKIPLEEPIKVTTITLHTEGVDAGTCEKMITTGNVPDRLVENLMLMCTPDDLRLSMDVEKSGSNTLEVSIAMEEEGNMIYFADELSWILTEEAQADAEGASVTVENKQTLTITYEEQPNMTMAYVLTAFGAVLGILAGLVMLLLEKKKAAA